MLKIYNTLTRKKEVFKPLREDEVTIYTCGPTVYNFSHIGNCRSFIFADVLRRYLKYKGYKVKQVRNLTDVDDKTIKGSMQEHVSLREFTEKYTNLFFEDMKTLNVETIEYNPRATDNITEMVQLIKKLMEKGYAYKTDDGIYFKISKFKNYGKLAHLDMKGLKSGATVKTDEYDKENVNDFALWKFWDEADGDVFWKTEIGKGRPGWHIECSAMSMKYLGETLDIHTGGVDLVFPHHQNEIAQSEAANDKKFVNYWVHCEHLLVDGKKMSKSLGNFYTLRDILGKGYDAKAIRYLLLSMSYKQQLNFTFDALEASQNTINRFKEFILNIRAIKKEKDSKKVDSLIKKAKKQFEKAMDDNLNTSEALAAIFDFMKEINVLMMDNKIGMNNAKEILNAMNDFDKVLGVLDFKEEKIDNEIEEMIQQREDARKKKDFATADRIRDELKQRGIVLEDTSQGVRWKKV
jgi:cysteinyl-tRNA synthetase